MAKLKVVHKWVGPGRVQSLMLILCRVGLGRVKKIGRTTNSALRPFNVIQSHGYL